MDAILSRRSPAQSRYFSTPHAVLCWTSLPIAYFVGGGRGGLTLDARQIEELWLTATQALLAVAVLARLTFRARDAVLLFVLFALQIAFPAREVRLGFAVAYAALGVVLLIARRREIPLLARSITGRG